MAEALWTSHKTFRDLLDNAKRQNWISSVFFQHYQPLSQFHARISLTLYYTPRVCTDPDHFKAFYLPLAWSKKSLVFCPTVHFSVCYMFENLTQHKLIIFLNPFLHPKGLYRPWPLQDLLSTTCLKQKIVGFLSKCSFFCLLYVEISTFFSEVSKTRVCVNFRVCRK